MQASRSLPIRPQMRMWAALLNAPCPLTTYQISNEADTSFQTADFRLNLWLSAGLIERIDGRPRRYRLLDTTDRSVMPPIINRHGKAVHRTRAGYERLWDAIRICKSFDVHEIRMIAATSEQTARGYVGMLQRVGYLRLERFGNPRLGIASRYRLIRNTGPKAPKETILASASGSKRLLIDSNSGERHDVGAGSPSKRRKYKTEMRAEASADPLADGGVC